ncbi:DUF6415 family natural product biosynthesis protein [Streptomyces cellostaticus]|uniref:DUF6415 family natural product biosynthesis protein n=1 Tax=Streptomyces TaxID=1883 RepID=UPI0020268B83|nr:DUF6415 family natural product biosynthesis protein [Streptomyces cellostaticus]
MSDAVENGSGTQVADLGTMREAVDLLLGPDDAPDALPPAPREVGALTVALRGHLELLVPEVESRAGRLSEDSIPRYCAMACVGEARRKLGGGARPGGDVVHARRLARVLRALCDHYEQMAHPPS